MKISVCIPTRNRPRLISACLTTLDELSSGQNDVVYVVGIDPDDQASLPVLQSLKSRINIRIVVFGDNVISGGLRWNALCANEKADAYSAQIDDAFPISPFWDASIASIAMHHEAFSWLAPVYPSSVLNPVATQAWIEKAGYFIAPHFPYWFNDTWFAEVVRYVRNEQVFMSHSLALYSKEEETIGFRDLDFWWGFFNATRVLRLADAMRISGFSGSQEDFAESRQEWIGHDLRRDLYHRGPVIAELEGRRAVSGEPSAKYVACYERARKLLVANGLELWTYERRLGR
jgi:glycosyltransferase involved in cell wall biosynthesis